MKKITFERLCIIASASILFACGGGTGENKSILDVFIGQGVAAYNSITTTSAASVVIKN